MTVGTQIRIKNSQLFTQRGVTVPGTVYEHKPFKFQPAPFSISNDLLKPKIIEAGYQTRALEGFLESPGNACTYAIASEPDHERARYFAAFLLSTYLQTYRNTRAIWHGLHDREDLIKAQAPCSFLVISGCNPTMTQYRVERVRDLIEHYSSIPKLVIIGGCDPLTFFYTKLFMRPTHFFFHSSSLMKRKVEVV